MVNDNFSCIKEVTKIVHLPLPAVYNSNEISGISDRLESWKRMYVQELQGIVVGFKNVVLTSKRCYLKIDNPVIHCSVKATFELFYPTIGSIIKGKINRVSHDYVGVLVHNTVNVAIHRTANEPSDVSKFIALDHFILFQITRLNLKQKIIHVKGKITEECISLMRESDLFNAEIDDFENNGLTYTPPDFSISKRVNNTNDATPDNSVENSSVGLENLTDAFSQVSSHSKKKKNKKSRDDLITSPSLFDKSVESEINEIEPTQPPATTSKKKHKKFKIETVAKTVTNNFSSDAMLSNKDETGTNLSNIHLSPTKSRKKKKSKKMINDSAGEGLIPDSTCSQNLSLGLQNPVDEFNHLSSPTKKKKRKKSKEDALESLPYSNEPPKKKRKKSKSENANSELVNNVDSLLNINEIHSDSSNTHTSPIKSKKSSSKNINEVYEIKKAFSSPEPPVKSQLENEISLDNKEQLNVTKQAKKRKRDSSGIDNLPKKKRKIKEGMSVKNKDKAHKKKKRNKEKSKKDSKKGKKKKSKDKVISTKKRLHGYKTKLEKKSKDKSEKSKVSKNKSNKKKSENVS